MVSVLLVILKTDGKINGFIALCWDKENCLYISIKNKTSRTSLMVQWVRLCLPMQGYRFRSLVRGLRSHVPLSQNPQNIKQKQYYNKLNKDFLKTANALILSKNHKTNLNFLLSIPPLLYNLEIKLELEVMNETRFACFLFFFPQTHPLKKKKVLGRTQRSILLLKNHNYVLFRLSIHPPKAIHLKCHIRAVVQLLNLIAFLKSVTMHP